MWNPSTKEVRTCEICSKPIKVHIVCFKCDRIYHPRCLRKSPAVYINEEGHAFCCWEITTKQNISGGSLQMQDDIQESVKEEDEYEHNDVFGNDEFIEADQQNTFTCEQCYFNFDEEVDLKTHYLQSHGVTQKLSKETIHLKLRNVDQKYKCLYCGFSTTVRLDLKKHIHTHVNTRDKPFKDTNGNCKCTPEQKEYCECDNATAEKNGRELHILTKHIARSIKYKCSHCKYATSKKSLLSLHLRTHTSGKRLKCTYKNCKCTPGQKELCECNPCKYAAVRVYSLRMHILTRHSERPKQYNCTVCKYATYFKEKLQEHIITHSSNRPFECTYKNDKYTVEQKQSSQYNKTGYVAKEKNTLKEPILLNSENKFKCRDCNYATYLKECLEQHIRFHTNDRPFICAYKNCKCTMEQKNFCKCDTCGFAAISETYLKSHITLMHTTELKRYMCTDCKYVTRRKDHLKAHSRIHTGEKPFVCTYKNCKCVPGEEGSCECNTCGYAATRKYTLNKHIKMKHAAVPK